jgi:hypothetical protein
LFPGISPKSIGSNHHVSGFLTEPFPKGRCPANQRAIRCTLRVDTHSAGVFGASSCPLNRPKSRLPVWLARLARHFGSFSAGSRTKWIWLDTEYRTKSSLFKRTEGKWQVRTNRWVYTAAGQNAKMEILVGCYGQRLLGYVRGLGVQSQRTNNPMN